MVQTLVGEFDSKRDKELIAAGTHFWCDACMIARPLDAQSPDPRYCQGCHDFLLKEAEISHPSRRPSWYPRPLKTAAKSRCPIAPDEALTIYPPESDSGGAGGKVRK
jgi:hypothetical protein